MIVTSANVRSILPTAKRKVKKYGHKQKVAIKADKLSRCINFVVRTNYKPEKNLEVHKSIDNFPIASCVVTVGMFDGVHEGHRLLLEELKREAAERGVPSVVVTLWPHPKYVLTGTYGSLRLLSTMEEKCELLSETGVDHLVVLDFTKRISAMSAMTFVREILIGKLHAIHFHMGYNHRFGSGKETLEELEAICKSAGLSCSRGSQYVTESQGSCSSSVIRDMLSRGDIEGARVLLGRPYVMSGTVVHGDAIGQKIGFPTANLCYEEYKMLPMDGVYAAKVRLDTLVLDAVVDIGMRPTVHGTEHRVEAHIMDFSSKIYGRSITIFFFSRIREEKRFLMLEELENQIVKDVSVAKDILSTLNI